MEETGAVDVFELVLKPPVRAYALAGGIAVTGAALTVVASALTWGTPAVAFGLALLVAGVVLLAAAVAATRRTRVRVELTDTGYRITGPTQQDSGRWADVTRITLAADGHRLTLHHAPESRTLLVSPAGAQDPGLEALGEAMARRLDLDRGYRELP